MVKQGYKPTEIGVIPEDWEVKELGECVDYIKGYPFKSKDYLTDGVRIIRISDTTYNSIKDESGIYVSNTVASKLKNWAVKEGDIIVTTVGSKPPMYDSMVGKTIYIKKKYEGALLNQNAVLFRNKSNSFQVLLNNLFKQKRYIEYIESIFRGNANQASITLDELFKFHIPLPPLAEQEAIATALSDADAWIENLEQLIAKKRLIKQGAMQELLTPKEDWIEYDFNKVVWFQEGPGLRNWQFTKDGIKVINVTNLENGYLNLAKTSRHISWNEFERMYKHFEIDDGDIVVASSGNSYGKVSVVRKQDLPLVMNTSVIRFKPSETIGYKYLLVFLKSFLFKDQIDLLITGGAQPNFGPAHLNKIKISSPKFLSEQERIATILSDMDAELEVLEKQLGKAQQIKQGMMQELLTGRVRLV